MMRQVATQCIVTRASTLTNVAEVDVFIHKVLWYAWISFELSLHLKKMCYCCDYPSFSVASGFINNLVSSNKMKENIKELNRTKKNRIENNTIENNQQYKIKNSPG